MNFRFIELDGRCKSRSYLVYRPFAAYTRQIFQSDTSCLGDVDIARDPSVDQCPAFHAVLHVAFHCSLAPNIRYAYKPQTLLICM